MPIKLESTAFTEGGIMPVKYTGEGENISPQLEWSGVPENTKSIAIICDDPDAPIGTWVHWVIFNISPNEKILREAIPAEKTLSSGAIQGINSSRKIGYEGPYPPSGTHRYFFKVYALDAMLNLKPGVTKADLLKAMEGRILGQGELMGRYSRKR